ncbi:hypothetical protein AsAng_0035170 [Aureispira anguillae]|uniref:Uncharacterized protein n=1 Tax=Aureispira anguillae TaxID=2864201 RepID=A0A916DUL3_9BACT|nr:hypothetical protein AsAng_0035170 [Aureispira anguillae]
MQNITKIDVNISFWMTNKSNTAHKEIITPITKTILQPGFSRFL